MPLEHLGCDVVLATRMGGRTSGNTSIAVHHWDIGSGVCDNHAVAVSYLVNIRRNLDVMGKL